MRKYFAEGLGTFVLVFIGTGTVALANIGTMPIGYLGIALAFGLTVTVMAYTVGGISGGHFNPAVSLAMIMNKRLGIKDGVFYMLSQFIGAIMSSSVISIFIKALKLPKNSFGQTDFPHISVGGAFFTETLLTFLFVLIILMVTSNLHGNSDLAPLAIGLALTLMIFVGLNLTGASLNPARSLGPALFAGDSALADYWLYFIAPLVGAGLASGAAYLMGSEE